MKTSATRFSGSSIGYWTRVSFLNTSWQLPSVFAGFPTIGAAPMIRSASAERMVGRTLIVRILARFGLAGHGAWVITSTRVLILTASNLDEPDGSIMIVIFRFVACRGLIELAACSNTAQTQRPNRVAPISRYFCTNCVIVHYFRLCCNRNKRIAVSSQILCLRGNLTK